MLVIGLSAKFYGIKINGKKQIDSVNRLSFIINKLKNQIWNFILSLLPSHSEEDEFDLINESNEERNLIEDTLENPVDNKSPLKEAKKEIIDKKNIFNDNLATKKAENNENDIENKKTNKSFKYKLVRKNSLIDKDFSKQPKTNNLSDAYLYALVWSCFLAQIYIRPRLLYLMPITLLFYITKWIWRSFQQTEVFSFYTNEINKWIDERKEVIFHPIFYFIYEYLLISDYVLSRTLKKSVNTLSSLFVIFFVIFGTLFATLFLAFQIYHESALLVELTANVMPSINSTYSSLVNSTDSEYSQILPKDFINDNIGQEILAKGYLHGRQWLQTTIRATFTNESPDSNLTTAVEKVNNFLKTK